jgi:hypothetical protein
MFNTKPLLFMPKSIPTQTSSSQLMLTSSFQLLKAKNLVTICSSFPLFTAGVSGNPLGSKLSVSQL